MQKKLYYLCRDAINVSTVDEFFSFIEKYDLQPLKNTNFKKALLLDINDAEERFKNYADLKLRHGDIKVELDVELLGYDFRTKEDIEKLLKEIKNNNTDKIKFKISSFSMTKFNELEKYIYPTHCEHNVLDEINKNGVTTYIDMRYDYEDVDVYYYDCNERNVLGKYDFYNDKERERWE